MNSISFDNPYLLFVALPLLAFIIVPFVFSVRKENANKHNITSFVLHILIAVLLTGILSGTKYETVLTTTNVYVLADVSYSSNDNLENEDQYISDIKKNLPKNSKMGVICFGKDYELLSDLGEKLKSVKEANVDNSETDIVSALDYAASLFKEDVIKRIVLITDGKETNSSNIVSEVETLTKKNIYIDAVYLDNNIKESTKEVELKSVDYDKTCFMNHEEKVSVLVQSNSETKAVLTLSELNELTGKYELYSESVVDLKKGLNVENILLDTGMAKEMNYEISITSSDDTSKMNNSLDFTQKVTSRARMLVVSSKAEDKEKFETLYKDNYDIDYYINDAKVPFTMEELCVYDEYVLSNVDVRDLRNSVQFVNNINTLVSELGKSLITVGNTYIQNNTSEELDVLSGMLPLKYGNQENDEKLVAIVLDISRSMEQVSRLAIARKVACGILDMLTDDDYVTVIGFAGEISVLQAPINLKNNREKIKDIINNCEPSQGTYMGSALRTAYRTIYSLTDIQSKEVMLISDGLPFGPEEDTALKYAQTIANNNIAISTFQMIARSDESDAEELMRKIAEIGKGTYYYAESEDVVDSIILTDLADDITESYIDDGNEHEVVIDKKKDSYIKGIDNVPSVSEFYYNSAKSKAEVVLSTDYVSDLGNTHHVPLYAYWQYGNGIVASYASEIEEDYLSDGNALNFLNNVIDKSTPEERIETPFIFELEEDGSYVNVSISAPSVNVGSSLKLIIADPEGNKEEYALAFDNEYYVTRFKKELSGKYNLTLNYDYGVMHYEAEEVYNANYKNEYDSFENYDISSLYYMVSDNGQIATDGKIKLTNDKSVITTYEYSFNLLFSILAVVMFIFDVIIRKLRLQDIKALFVRDFRQKKGEK